MTTRGSLELPMLKYLRDADEPVSVEDLVTHFCGRPDVDIVPTQDPRRGMDQGRHQHESLRPSTARKFTFIAVRDCLDRLAKAGLIEGWRESNAFNFEDTKVSISKNFHAMQSIIGFSLTDAFDPRLTPLKPIFGRPKRIDECDIFVIMPFSEEMEPVYKIVRACGEWLGQRVKRADEIFGASRQVMQIIWEQICNSKVVVAMGIAHAAGRAEVVLLTQEDTDVPFDLRPFQFVPYAQSQVKHSDGYEFADKVTHALAYALGIGLKHTSRGLELDERK